MEILPRVLNRSGLKFYAMESDTHRNVDLDLNFTITTAPGEKIPQQGAVIFLSVWEPGPPRFRSPPEKPVIHAVAAFRRGVKVATGVRQIKIWNVKEVTPILVEDVLNRIEPRIRHHAENSFFDERHPAPTTSQAIRNALSAESSEISAALNSIASRLHGWTGDVSRLSVQAQEKDATLLALDIFGENRAHLVQASGTVEPSAPFLSNLSNYTPLEDHMINHDLTFFEGIRSTPGSHLGCAVFETLSTDGPKKLTVFNANRGPVERALGVDLVYYNETCRSYILVQYKKMKKEAKEWRFRGDPQFHAEMNRMLPYNKSPSAQGWKEYRIEARPFYFKFVRAIDFQPSSTDLLPGMYIPLDLMEELLRSQDFITEKGNLVLDHRAPRLDANTFTNLAKNGLIGSRGTTTDEINRICRESLEGNRSLILAREQTNAENDT